MPLDLSANAPLYEIKADLFKALGHPARIRILEVLCEGETPVSVLLNETGLEASHLSQHLAVLRKAGVVTARREGNNAHYKLAHSSIADLLQAGKQFLIDSLSQTRDNLADLAKILR